MVGLKYNLVLLLLLFGITLTRCYFQVCRSSDLIDLFFFSFLFLYYLQANLKEPESVKVINVLYVCLCVSEKEQEREYKCSDKDPVFISLLYCQRSRSFTGLQTDICKTRDKISKFCSLAGRVVGFKAVRNNSYGRKSSEQTVLDSSM